MKTNHPAFVFRPIAEGDLTQVLEVYRQSEDFLALGPVPDASLQMVQEDLRHSVEEGGVFCGIYDSSDKLIGVLDYNLVDAPIAFIALLMVAGPHRGKGIGHKIIEQFEGLVCQQAQHIHAIQLDVQVNNPRGLHFWHRLGFRVIGQPVRQADTTVTVKMEKVVCRPVPA